MTKYYRRQNLALGWMESWELNIVNWGRLGQLGNRWFIITFFPTVPNEIVNSHNTMANQYYPKWDSILAGDLVETGVLVRKQMLAEDDDDPWYQLSEAGWAATKDVLEKLYQCKWYRGLMCVRRFIHIHLISFIHSFVAGYKIGNKHQVLLRCSGRAKKLRRFMRPDS
jgi:hypothetical protein